MGAVQAVTFGALLKRYRRAAGLTQEALAEKAGYSAIYVRMLERGARAPLSATVALLAEALQLSDEQCAALTAAARCRRDDGARAGGAPETALPIGGFLGALPTGPLAGREAELAVIEDALEAVAQGHGRLLVLSGEPGVGKTRLAQEITLKARAQGFRVITGRCYEPQQTAAYSPFLEALAIAVPLAEAGVDNAVQAPWSKRWPEVARLLPNQMASAPASLQIDDRNAQQRLFWQVAGFFQALAELAPFALLLDDLHWADGASLDLLQHLTRHTRERRILLVGTAREVEARRQHPLATALSDLSRDEMVQRLAVRPLGSEETTALIGATLGGADGAAGTAESVSADLAQRIYQRSEGNAFFTRQLARALQEQGDLRFTAGQWRLSADIAPAAFTSESIRAVIGQRLGRLTPLTQEVLREASILGQVFVFTDLQRLGGRGEQEVEEALEEAVTRGIVREGERDRYHFNHAFTLDTLYADLSARRKRRLHRAAADAIEQLPDHERRATELAHHLLAADEGARALPYTLLAGDQAETVYAHPEAEAHYRAALMIAQELGDGAHEAEALEKLGIALHLQGRHDQAIESLKGALRAYEVLQDQDRELRALAALLEVQGMYGREMADEALARAQAILARIDPSDGSTLTPARASGLAAVYRGLALVYLGSGRREEQLTAARRAVELARIAGDEAQLAWALHRLNALETRTEDPAVRDDILAMAERTGQTMLVVFSHNMIGERHANAGEFALGMPHMEQSLAAAERRQDPNYLAWQLHNFAWFLFDFGDWERARDIYSRAASIKRAADPNAASWHSAVMTIWPGMLALVEGREEEGRRLLEQAIIRIEQVGVVDVLPSAVGPLAEADLLAGHAERARLRLASLVQNPAIAEGDPCSALPLLAWAEGALGRYAEAEARLATLLATAKPLVRVDALRVRGLLATMQGHWMVGVAALEEALERARAMPYPYGEAKTLWVYGRLEAAHGDPATARERFIQALAICERLGEGLYRPHIERALAEVDST